MKKKPQLQTERLRQLANYLLSEEANEEFYGIDDAPEFIDHGEFVEETLSFYSQAVNHSVVVFKDEWKWAKNKQAVWKGDKYQTTFTSTMTFYGLTSEQFQHLFIPKHQNALLFGGKELDYVTTPAQIGHNIIDMLFFLSICLN